MVCLFLCCFKKLRYQKYRNDKTIAYKYTKRPDFIQKVLKTFPKVSQIVDINKKSEWNF